MYNLLVHAFGSALCFLMKYAYPLHGCAIVDLTHLISQSWLFMMVLVPIYMSQGVLSWVCSWMANFEKFKDNKCKLLF